MVDKKKLLASPIIQPKIKKWAFYVCTSNEERGEALGGGNFKYSMG